MKFLHFSKIFRFDNHEIKTCCLTYIKGFSKTISSNKLYHACIKAQLKINDCPFEKSMNFYSIWRVSDQLDVWNTSK